MRSGRPNTSLAVSKVKVVVSLDKWEKFHHDKYLSNPRVTPVVLDGSPNKMRVVKTAGEVDIPGTIEQGIFTYPASRGEYVAALNRQQAIEDADMVIDFGVPQMVRAAYEENLRRMVESVWNQATANSRS